MKPLDLYAHRLWALACLFAAVVLSGCGAAPGNTFEWTITPERRTIAPGGQAVYNVAIQKKVNINAQVSMRVEGLPPGATATFDPGSPIPDTTSEVTLTIQTAANTEVGTYIIKVFAQEAGGIEFQTDRQLVIETSGGAPDFSLELTPAEVTLTSGGISPTITYYTRPLNGFSGTVNVSLSGVSDDMALSQPPTPASYNIGTADHGGAGGTFVLRYDPHGAITSPVDVVVTTTSGGITHTRTLRVTLEQESTPGGDFTIDVTPNPANVFLGIAKTFTVTVTPTGGFTGNVDLSFSGQPNGLVVAWQGASSVAVGPNAGTATLYVMPDLPGLPATITLTVTGTSGTLTHSKTLTLNYSPG